MLALGADSTVAPVSLAAARLVIGGLVLALATGPFLASAVNARPRGALVLAALAVAGYQLAYFAAVDRTGVAVGTMVSLGSGPVFTGALAWLIDRKRPALRWAAATALAVAGCAVLVLGGARGGGQVEVSGVLLALLGGFLYAFYTVTAARVIAAGAPSGAVMGVMFGCAAVVMLPILLWSGVGWLTTPGGLLVALYLGCVTTALSYILYGVGLRTTPVATAVTLTLAEPAVASLLGVAVLGERLSPVSTAGLALLAAGLIMVALPTRTADRQAAQSSS
ncbi:drug/metabolite transporter, DME family [Thermostaphylospora chromogena]|uniref:Drug/metabolite transporter, DME family n=2 Tax=Thermostaphylospora chromogena TaxID=35622 RepID=A0A1H1DK86_9ACTN|nr:drug/metabolite transporter, DME family [Thermostaphylospora chromogena]